MIERINDTVYAERPHDGVHSWICRNINIRKRTITTLIIRCRKPIQKSIHKRHFGHHNRLCLQSLWSTSAIFQSRYPPRSGLYWSALLKPHLELQKKTNGIILTRTRADQHKCLPTSSCINSTPLLFWEIVVDSKNYSEIGKKKLSISL